MASTNASTNPWALPRRLPSMCYRRRLLLDRSLTPFSVVSEHPLDNCHSPLTRAPRRRPAKRGNAGEMPGRLKGHSLEYYRTFLTALHQGVVRATVLGTTLAPVNGLTPDAIVEESCQVVHSSKRRRVRGIFNPDLHTFAGLLDDIENFWVCLA
jgi:hypothetical protein